MRVLRQRREIETRSARHARRRLRKELEYLQEVADRNALRLRKQRRRQRKVKTVGVPIMSDQYYAGLYAVNNFTPEIRAKLGNGAVIRDIHIDNVPALVLVISRAPLPEVTATVAIEAKPEGTAALEAKPDNWHWL
jgi:hypothetical protein